MLGANLSNILEVAIGLAFVFSVLSLLVSITGEFVAGLFGLRANTLHEGIESLAGSDTAERIYDHALVRAQGRSSWFDRRFRDGNSEVRPSYLDPQTVATALLDELREDGAAINGRPTAGAIALNVNLDHTRDDIVAAMNQLPTELRDQLRPVVERAVTGVHGARRQLDAIQDATATWFDQAMDRVSGWYKRRIQLWLFLIGLALAAVLNVDTLFIAQELYDDPELRTSVADSASQFIEASAALDPSEITTPATLGTALDELVKRVAADAKELESAGIPIGWQHVTDTDGADGSDARAWFARFLGWFVTALALSLGAPFWFDLLSKLVSLRSAGKKLTSTASTS